MGPAIAGLFGSLFGTVANFISQKQTNASNRNMIATQLQTARRDAEAAGFSPMAALGSGNYATTFQSPQIDTSGAVASLQALADMKMREKEYKLQKELKEIQKNVSDAQVGLLEEQKKNVTADTVTKNALRGSQVKQAENEASISDITLEERAHDKAINLANSFLRSTDSGDKALAIRSVSKILSNTGTPYEQDRVQTVLYDFLNTDEHGDMQKVVACYKSSWNPNVYVVTYDNKGVHDTYYYDFHDHSIKKVKKGRY